LRAQPDTEVIVSSSDGMELESIVRDTDPDVLILDVDGDESENGRSLDVLSRIAGEVPTIALIDGPSSLWLARAALAGVRGFLRHGVLGDELESTLRAVVSGLVVLSPEFSEVMLARAIHIDSDELESPVESLTPRELI